MLYNVYLLEVGETVWPVEPNMTGVVKWYPFGRCVAFERDNEILELVPIEQYRVKIFPSH